MTSTNSTNQHPAASSDMPSQSASNTNIDANNTYTPNENQLADLVEAATAAADPQWGAHTQLENYDTNMQLGDDGFGDNFASGMGVGRHLRVSNDHSQGSLLSRTASKKRKRNNDNLDPALTASFTETQQPQPQSPRYYTSQPPHPSSLQSLSDARAVGVHSAAALFRQPSSNKKYTRPPMSKLFASLELSPENFLHLQSAAKAYMLHKDYPDRRDCVGQRGKGDTEMVKLRLWNCVRHFLENEGNGERFFGENVVNENMDPRTHIWPRDTQKIISLVIPLLRRMVTNERQRQYAVESRRGGNGSDRRKTNEGFHDSHGAALSPDHHLQMNDQDHRAENLAPPPLVQESQAGMDSNPAIDIGLTDLFVDGYSLDWAAISSNYDMYNEHYELDNLGSLSGLNQPDWRGIVAAVDSHYAVVHNGGYDCVSECEDCNVNRIVHSNSISDLPWRISGGGRNDFASSITRDVSRIIRENIAAKQNHEITPSQPNVPLPALPTQTSPDQQVSTASSAISSMEILLRINILQHGKRLFPRVDIPTTLSQDLSTVKKGIMRTYPGQIPGCSILQDTDSILSAAVATPAWKISAWLPDGLLPIRTDKDWSFALVQATAMDWMDGGLTVLVEVSAPNTQ
ncbi:hypothetical protein N7495_004613 [Penicillium taxi]|uniref:uncharacterized protein n=1 Tax=Penicillium taxi TaxID=168475 RepID=UPI0025457019|nr:uncharacterized protein N7495_004613 [Penicillium taxi]KAJ5899869.1 hypothetical protein N7495_004613 [Penicillium taxi]